VIEAGNDYFCNAYIDTKSAIQGTEEVPEDVAHSPSLCTTCCSSFIRITRNTQQTLSDRSRVCHDKGRYVCGLKVSRQVQYIVGRLRGYMQRRTTGSHG
jgi:hypothetical protein